MSLEADAVSEQPERSQLEKKRFKTKQLKESESESDKEKDSRAIQPSTWLFLLLWGATALEDFEVDETERHEAQSETGHDSGEEDEETRDAGVDTPPQGSEGDRLAF